MKSEYTVSDKLDHLTVLYHRGCKQGFKFFGDDPEEQKEYITDEHVEILKEVYTNYSEFPYEFITKFYAHSRCLVFPDGMWMSETARHPQYLRYKPGSYCNFRVSGLTRFTSLTEGASALCVGINPNDGEIPCYRRIVHNIDVNAVFQPMYTDSYLIPTRDCMYGSTEVKEGTIIKSRGGCNPAGYTFIFKEKGQLIEFTQEPFTMEESVLNLGQQWATKRIEVFDR